MYNILIKTVQSVCDLIIHLASTAYNEGISPRWVDRGQYSIPPSHPHKFYRIWFLKGHLVMILMQVDILLKTSYIFGPRVKKYMQYNWIAYNIFSKISGGSNFFLRQNYICLNFQLQNDFWDIVIYVFHYLFVVPLGYVFYNYHAKRKLLWKLTLLSKVT